MLELAIVKQWRDFKLDMALSIGDGLLVLFGPSGSGKSLTLQCIAGLLRPDYGRIAINGRVVFDDQARLSLPPQQRRVGYVPQGYGLFPHLTAAENIAYGLRGQPPVVVKGRVSEMMARMRLQGLADHRPHQLSGGQQQRVALARALIVEPEILLMDEPFAALDSAIRGKLRQDILGLSRSFAGTIVFVTHDLAEAYMLGDQIAVVDQGRVLQAGPRDEVTYHPRTRTVARFTGAKNIFAGHVVAGSSTELRIAVDGYQGFTVTAPPYRVALDERVEFCIRPDDIMLLRRDRPAGAAVHENQLRGEIVADLAVGAGYVLFFKLDSPAAGGHHDYDLEINLPRHAYEQLGLATERKWTVSLKKRAIHVIGKDLID